MDLIKIRRFFHQFPETSFKEKRTTVEIINKLEEMGVKYTYGRNLYKSMGKIDSKEILDQDIQKGFTGVMAQIGEGPYIFVRADIDGLPVKESESQNHIPYKEGFRSSNNMHACGHDGHIALGLGMVDYFVKNNISAKVLFQPAEEDCQGAAAMDLDYLLKDVKNAIGFHIGLGQKAGTIGVGSTGFMAATKFDLEFIGRSAHACNSPQDGVSAFNMVLAFSSMINELTYDSRGRKTMNIGKVYGGDADNIVMRNCTLEMDLRTTENYLMEEMMKGIRKIADGVSSARGGKYEIRIKTRAESYIEKDVKLVDRLIDVLDGKGITVTRMPDFGASEDVTRYFNYIKDKGGNAIHLLLGADLKGPHHSPEFDYDDRELDFYLDALKLVCDEI